MRPGTKSDQFFCWPDESLEEMDSTLAVQQYIQQTIRRDPTNIVDILNAPEGQVTYDLLLRGSEFDVHAAAFHGRSIDD